MSTCLSSRVFQVPTSAEGRSRPQGQNLLLAQATKDLAGAAAGDGFLFFVFGFLLRRLKVLFYLTPGLSLPNRSSTHAAVDGRFNKTTWVFICWTSQRSCCSPSCTFSTPQPSNVYGAPVAFSSVFSLTRHSATGTTPSPIYPDVLRAYHGTEQTQRSRGRRSGGRPTSDT